MFLFKHSHEAKKFYNEFIRNSNTEIIDYAKMLGYKYRSLKGSPEKENISDNFTDFFNEYKTTRSREFEKNVH